ncbi:unnamed protein product [Knipowitschia caucasica]|uniref:Peptidase M1 leukotriene A4 hydrolase/aminopeptidase C-terminal domain-containing protein n=1 Tax=Knipowitschia caucasica TaxID=637954 RepID=A0AAV2J7C0_KNICA
MSAPGSLFCCRSLHSSGGHCAAPGSEHCRPLVDVASSCNHADFHLRHFHLDLQINFAQKQFSGWLVMDLSVVSPGAQVLLLDSHPSLMVRSVDFKDSTRPHDSPQEVPWSSDTFTEFGSTLRVALPELKAARDFQITIRYSTTDGPAVWWLDPELTCGQTRPLVFTQGHCVCNRSFFPCFDTPAVKSPYSATVRVPDGFTVLMSASRSMFCRDQREFRFWMDEPVPSYLVALVCGDLQHHDLGPRSRVWAEPSLLSCAVQKIGGSVEHWLSVAEELFGAYLWSRCDLVFLPPSFPIVAMENPCLTFIISSVLESSEVLLVDLVHEISHGWFGNAVTNASWEDMWLSEGLATYAQRRITKEVYGDAFTCLETVVRLDALHRQLRLVGDTSSVSRLQAPLERGVNPSSLMNLFTYEKGFCFVSYLCEVCGSQSEFDLFLKDYIAQFQFQSVVAQDLILCFLQHFPHLHSTTYRTDLQLDQWLSACGPPLYEPDLSAGGTLTQPVFDLLSLWSQHMTSDLCNLSPPSPHFTSDLCSWSTFQIVLFLDRLLDQAPLPQELMSHLSACYSAHFWKLNAEVQIRWLQLCVRCGFCSEMFRVRDFLHKHTSRMYTLPLYEELASGSLRSRGLEIFNQSQRSLHPSLRRSLQALLTNQSTSEGNNHSTVKTLHKGPPANHNEGLPANHNEGLPANHDEGPPANHDEGLPANHDGGQQANHDGGQQANHDGGQQANHDGGQQANHDGGQQANHDGGQQANHDGGQQANHDGGQQANHDGGQQANHDGGQQANHDGGQQANHDGGQQANHDGGQQANHDGGQKANHNGGPLANQNGGQSSENKTQNGKQIKQNGGQMQNPGATNHKAACYQLSPPSQA